MSSSFRPDIEDGPDFVNQPANSGVGNESSLSQPKEAAEVFNLIDYMDSDERAFYEAGLRKREEVRQSKNDEEAVEHVATENESKTKKNVLIVGAILLAVAIAIGVGIGVSSSSSNLPPALPATTGPAPSPTLAPVPLERDAIAALIQARSASTSFSDSSSPQSQSLDWILSDPFSSDGLSEDRLVQRFAMATLYYSTNGNNWDHGGWVESKNECDWDNDNDGVRRCSQEFMLVGLDLLFDSLFGRIPIEVGLLTHLKFLSFSLNKLTGSMPTELGLLTQLEELHLSGNQLTGSLPTELGLMTQLKQLRLHVNQLKGSLPSELGVLTQLTQLGLANNHVTGSMPSSLCSSGLVIHIDCGEIACTCCVKAFPSTISC